MIAEALAGNTVVRLNGGDPFVFGRGGVFVTGHTAQAGMTLVVYMAVSACGTREPALLAAGWPLDTPVAMVENVTLPGERRLYTQIGGMSAFATDNALRSPAIMVIGEVVRAAARAACDPEQAPAYAAGGGGLR